MGDPLNHFAVATSPAMISFINGLDRFGTAILRDEVRSPLLDRTIGVQRTRRSAQLRQAQLEVLARDGIGQLG